LNLFFSKKFLILILKYYITSAGSLKSEGGITMVFPFCFEYFSLQDGGELPVPNKRSDATDKAFARADDALLVLPAELALS
jgi:hypothetical protein